ncbi:ferritin-like domain-containing protein [bacterium]|nr:ferritin-like domain-containing protein [bacterium]
MTEPQTVSEFAERVLMSTSLEDKLTHAPASLTLDPPLRGGFTAPPTPGRPDHLKPKPNDGKSPFPSTDQIHDEEQRGILLHFFANHELLAAELMALALLKFPDAPDSFRKGVLRTLQEEQNHTLWYLARMKECGLNFGDYHLSPMIWSHISSMESPLDYVSRLSLTFEQANLDYAKHYSQVLARAGDQKSADLLAQIYKDEIAHVGYGLKWLRRWKQNAKSDWDAWHKQLHFPLSPIRAKGMAPFNEEGRRKAGMNEHFIASIKRYQASRGRSPDLYWFNPDVELAANSKSWTSPKRLEEVAADLEYAFALAAPSPDDLVLLRNPPSDKHRESLACHDLTFAEIAPLSDFKHIHQSRKIRREHPWGTPKPNLLSKKIGLELRNLLGRSIPAQVCDTKGKIRTFIEAHPCSKWLAKPLLSSAGRGLINFTSDQVPTIKGDFLIEPWLDKEHEFSLLYQSNPADQGGLRFLGLCHQEVSKSGQWVSSMSAPKPASGLPAEHARLIANKVLPAAKKEILGALRQLLESHHYHGPVCIDSFLHRTPEGLQWHQISEINARWSMGRLAHNLRLKLCPNRSLTLTTIPKDAPLPKNAIALGDPTSACSRIPIVTGLGR